MKLAPASGGASLRPGRLGRWQLAQLVWYAFRPSVAWSAVYAGGVWLRPAVAITETAISAGSGARNGDTVVANSIANSTREPRKCQSRFNEFPRRHNFPLRAIQHG